MAESQEAPQPPRAPSLERRPRFTPLQRWGLPLLALAPVLALTGLLGVTSQRVTATEGPLTLEVEHPNRARKGVTATLTVTVRNAGPAPLADVVLELERGYLESFEEADVEPAPDAATQDAFRFELGELEAGASRVVSAVLTADRYWRRPGTARVEAAGVPPLSLRFATFTFP